MNKLKIKKLKLQNFLCYGPDGIDIDFEHYGNIIVIKGINYDTAAANVEARTSSNGAGKSSVAEGIIFTLFGKLNRQKNKKHYKLDKIINCKTGSKGKLRAEIWVDNLKIVRRRNPDDLKVWEMVDDKWSEITKSTMKATEAFIESRIGLTLEAFVNLVIFTDDNSGSFLECDLPKKREIVESLLALNQYAYYGQEAHERIKKSKAERQTLDKLLDMSMKGEQNAKRNIESLNEQKKKWETNKINELNVLVARIKSTKLELESTDTGAALKKYDEAQEQIFKYNDTLPEKEAVLNKIKEMLDAVDPKEQAVKAARDEINLKIQELKLSITRSKSSIKENIAFIKDQEAAKCKFCGKWDETATLRAKNIVESETIKLSQFEEVLTKEQGSLDKYNDNLNNIAKAIKSAEDRFREVTNEVDLIRRELNRLNKIDKPEASVNEKVLEDRLAELKKQILAKEVEFKAGSPYEENIVSAVETFSAAEREVEQKRDDLNDEIKLAPYYEYWVKAFSEKGIRKSVMDEIIPSLNERIAYWLEYLIDNKISISFDNELKETIHRNPVDGDSFVFESLSGGEKRRANLAVSQAFAYIMMLNTGTVPSLVFLDEVATNIDQIGIQGIYNMIVQLSLDRQVLVTTHDQGLLDLLNGCDTIELEKRNGLTTMKA